MYLDKLKMNGRVAVVVGAGQGMGFGIAQAIAEAGGRVVAVDVDADRAERTAGIIGLDQCIHVAADVTNQSDIERIIQEVRDKWGDFDVLASVVGGVHGLALRHPVHETSVEDWDRVVDLNLKHFFLLTRVFANYFIQAGKSGVMLNISSVNGINTAPNHAAYGASKAGLINLTKTLAVELGPHGIRVNGIAPGTIFTDRSADAYTPRVLDRLNNLIPLRRLGLVEDVAGAALFLLSDLSTYITGQTLVVDGGVLNIYPFDLEVAKD